MPSKGGKVVAIQPNSRTPLLKHWDTATSSYVVQAAPALSANQLRHYYPQQYNTRVVTIWGSFSNTTPAATTIQPPLHYVGHLKKTWDPADPADFTDIKSWVSGDAFWWGADLVLRCAVGREALLVRTEGRHVAQAGDTVHLRWPAQDTHAFDAEGRRLPSP